MKQEKKKKKIGKQLTLSSRHSQNSAFARSLICIFGGLGLVTRTRLPYSSTPRVWPENEVYTPDSEGILDFKERDWENKVQCPRAAVAEKLQKLCF